MVNMETDIPVYKINSAIRELRLGSLSVGGDTSISFMQENNNNSKPFFALEIQYFEEDSYSKILKEFWGTKDFTLKLKKAEESDCDIICVQFNISDENMENNLLKHINELNSHIEKTTKPIIIKGTNIKETDKIILPEIAKNIKKQIAIACIEETNYEQIIPEIVKNNHIAVLRSPIDINLAKELNILSIELGLSADKIIIDTDMGALGYGLDYGYSMIEKIKQAGFEGDNMLDMPIITFIGAETYKTKEAKSSDFNENWGIQTQRAVMWEITAGAAVISAGANIVVFSHGEALKTLKELIWN